MATDGRAWAAVAGALPVVLPVAGARGQRLAALGQAGGLGGDVEQNPGTQVVLGAFSRARRGRRRSGPGSWRSAARRSSSAAVPCPRLRRCGGGGSRRWGKGARGEFHGGAPLGNSPRRRCQPVVALGQGRATPRQFRQIFSRTESFSYHCPYERDGPFAPSPVPQAGSGSIHMSSAVALLSSETFRTLRDAPRRGLWQCRDTENVPQTPT